MKVIWTQEAIEQLIEIEDFISNDSPKRAAEFVDKIIDHAEAILTRYTLYWKNGTRNQQRQH
jgi:plasmid stabilization system protein ParE